MQTNILFSKDIRDLQETHKESELGRKGLSLTLLQKFLLPVPDFFVIKTHIFKTLMSKVSHNANIATLEELRKEIVDNELPEHLGRDIETVYRRMSGFGKAWVAVRASISCPNHPEITFSGLLDTYLNVRDVTEIELAAKEIYASAFSQSVNDYLKNHGLSYADISVAIVVQKMIQSEVSGTLYTFDPITLNRDRVAIEAVFGLGDVITDGSINPDTYIVTKQNNEVIEKKVVPQEWMKVRRIGEISELEHIQKIKISKTWQYSQKLDESLIKELTAIASRIETIFDRFQVIEWTMEGGRIWILQIKTVTPKNKEPLAKAKEVLGQPPHRLKKKQPTSDTNSEDTNPIAELKDTSDTLLFLGNPASPGIANGKALIMSPEITKDDSLIRKLLQQCTKQTILVAEEFSSTLEPFFYVVGGVITNFGGINSDAAITARELGLPAIVGTRIATTFIQNGTDLKIDGTSGTVYKVDAPKDISISDIPEVQQQLPDTTPTAPQIEKKQPVLEPSVVKIFVAPKVGQSSYCYIAPDDKIDTSQDYYGAMIEVNEVDNNIIRKIKKTKTHISGTVYIAILQALTLDELYERKRKLSIKNIRRTKKTKIILNISSFYQLLHLKDFAESGIDGIILDLESLLRQYQATSPDDTLIEFIAQQLATLKQIPLEIISASIKSNDIIEAFPKYIVHLAQSGCNSVVISKGSKQLSLQDIISFSTAYSAAILKLPSV